MNYLTDIDLDADLPTAPEQVDQPVPCTEKQVSYIASLVNGRVTDGILPQIDQARGAVMARQFSRKAASDLINLLLSQPRASQARIDAGVTEGMYRMNDVIYKVQRAVHGSGNLYAKRLVVEEPDCGGCQNGDPCNPPCEWTTEFVYAPGVVQTLRGEHKMTAEEAKEFGRLYGVCVRCGRTLTDEGSIALGIGPVCAGKEGWL